MNGGKRICQRVHTHTHTHTHIWMYSAHLLFTPSQPGISIHVVTTPTHMHTYMLLQLSRKHRDSSGKGIGGRFQTKLATNNLQHSPTQLEKLGNVFNLDTKKKQNKEKTGPYSLSNCYPNPAESLLVQTWMLIMLMLMLLAATVKISALNRV